VLRPTKKRSPSGIVREMAKKVVRHSS
jgi:hypothetical protein